MTTTHPGEVRPGDVVVYDGEPHQIIRIERHQGWESPIACDGSGWAIALGRDLIVLRGDAD